MSVYVAEFLGTMLLILTGGGVVAGVLLKLSKAENAGWFSIVVAWGLSVTFAIYAVGQISGAHINPAVTIALASIDEFAWRMVPGYVIAQVLGAMAGALLVWLHYLPHWGKTNDQGTKLAVFCTGPAIRSYAANLISEIIGTGLLVLGLLFIGANQFTEGLNPLVVGGLIMLIGFGLGGTTGFAINPARDFGPRLMHSLLPIKGKGKSDWPYAFVPIVGPIIGGILGAQIHKAVFHQEITTGFWIIIVITLGVVFFALKEEKKKSTTEP